MERWPFTLKDIEDRALAMCEDAYIDAPTAKNILEIWYKRSVSFSELRRIYAKLHATDLVRAYIKNNGRICLTEFRGNRTNMLFFRATARAKRYLNCGERYVT